MLVLQRGVESSRYTEWIVGTDWIVAIYVCSYLSTIDARARQGHVTGSSTKLGLEAELDTNTGYLL